MNDKQNQNKVSELLDEIDHMEYGNFNYLERLIDLSNHKDYEVRFRAIEMLGAFEEEIIVIERVRTGLKDPDELVRTSCLELLGDWQDCSSKNMVILLLEDESTLVRGAAALALGQFGDKIVIPILEKKISEVTNDEEKLRYFVALACLGDEASKEKFLEYLKHPFYRVRCAVATMLVEFEEYLSSKKYIGLLEVALEHEDTNAAASSIKNAIDDLR